MSSSAANASTSATSAAAGGAGGGGGGTAPRGPSPDEMLVYWLDLALLCVVGAFFIAFLPRAIGRFSNFSEWTRGLILRSGSGSGSSSGQTQQRVMATGGNERLYRVNTAATYVADDYSDQSHTLANHSAYAPARSGKEWSSLPSGSTIKSPVHIPSLTSILHPLSRLISYPITPSKSAGKWVLVGVYLAGIGFITFFMGGNPLAEPDRLGYIAISQIPVAVALGTKNNVVGMLLGMGYERLNYLHRCVGVVSFVASAGHALGYIYKWGINETLVQKLLRPFVVWGLVGLGGVSLLYFASLGVVRQKAYTLFLFSHIAGNVLYFVGICYHEPVCIKWVLLSVGIYAIDHLLRLLKTRFSTARLTAVPSLNLTRIELPGVGAGWRAGQHVRLRILSGEMGLVGWSVAHPFTIANASESEGGRGMVLLVKKAGGWTGRVFDAARREGEGGYGAEKGYGNGGERVREMRVVVEGPYGGLGNMVMSSYSAVLLVAGGSGITFGVGQAEELAQQINAGKSGVKFIEVVWVTQDKASLAPMLPTFAALISSVSSVPGVIMRITIHYTRVSPSSAFAPETLKSGGSSLDAHLATLAPNLTLHAGRPSIARTLSSIASLTSGVPGAKGLAVGVCGPLSLAGEVGRAVRGVDGQLRTACGGVELHEEVFGW